MCVDRLRELLDAKADQYECEEFIEADPICVPHRYTLRQDIEVMALLSATIAWGNRKAIVAGCRRMADMFGISPFDFIMSASDEDVCRLSSFVYRTFQKEDLPGMVQGLRSIYQNGGGEGLERLFLPREGETIRNGIAHFRSVMLPHLASRTYKHLADVEKGAAGKRINMFLRWMVRPAARGVDFGLWKSISPSRLIIPLDVHTARTARLLGLIQRKQNDWKAAEELTRRLSEFNAADPVRYDFALFSLGIIEKIEKIVNSITLVDHDGDIPSIGTRFITPINATD